MTATLASPTADSTRDLCRSLAAEVTEIDVGDLLREQGRARRQERFALCAAAREIGLRDERRDGGTDVGGVVGDAEPGDRGGEVVGSVLGSPVVTELEAAGDVGVEVAVTVDDSVVDGL